MGTRRVGPRTQKGGKKGEGCEPGKVGPEGWWARRVGGLKGGGLTGAVPKGRGPTFRAVFPSRSRIWLFVSSLGVLPWNCGRGSRPNSTQSAGLGFGSSGANLGRFSGKSREVLQRFW